MPHKKKAEKADRISSSQVSYGTEPYVVGKDLKIKRKVIEGGSTDYS